jgi:mono/diheme cytochrome c family protein
MLRQELHMTTAHRDWLSMGGAVTAAVAAAVLTAGCGGGGGGGGGSVALPASEAEQAALVAQGKQIFRFDTFGDEAHWTDTLRMHEVISKAISPAAALAVGLKVDSEALPSSVVKGIQDGSVDLTSPATTVALLKLDAVVGLKGTVVTVDGKDSLARVGVTCALCHSTVDNSFAPGIGRRLDGWPNRDLNPGAIIALSPAVDAAKKAVYLSWGKGKYDPRYNIDGLSKPVVIPPAYGLDGIHSITFTGDGADVAYWNRYVAVTQMGGQGSFSEPRLNLSITNGTADLVTGKLPALQAYQLSLKSPVPPQGSFDAAAAARGKVVFEGAGKCASCHSGALFTDANATLHPPGDSMAEPEMPSYAARSATRMYRTSPLRGAWQHAPYFHDGSAATLEEVVGTYNVRRSLGLTPQEIQDLAQYLKSQ